MQNKPHARKILHTLPLSKLKEIIQKETSFIGVLRHLGLNERSRTTHILKEVLDTRKVDYSHIKNRTQLRWSHIATVIAKSHSQTEALSQLNIKNTGGNRNYLKKEIQKRGIDISHFRRNTWNKGKYDNRRLQAKEILVVLLPSAYRTRRELLHRALLELGKEEVCEVCQGGIQWQGKPLRLEIDHIDGNWRNNQAKNLRFLCPNCHTQTPTYGNSGRTSR